MNNRNKSVNRLVRTALCIALLTASGAALADPENARYARGGPDAAFDPGRQLAGALQRLDLSEAQEQAIRKIFDDNREDLQGNRAASRDLRAEIQAVLQAEVLDEKALADLARREGELAEERVLLTGTLISELLAELDDDQRAELQAMQAERQDRRRDRLGARATRD